VIQGNHIGADASITQKHGVEIEHGFSNRFVIGMNTLTGNSLSGLSDGSTGKAKSVLGNVCDDGPCFVHDAGTSTPLGAAAAPPGLKSDDLSSASATPFRRSWASLEAQSFGELPSILQVSTIFSPTRQCAGLS
jgi:hypothetical protein